MTNYAGVANYTITPNYATSVQAEAVSSAMDIVLDPSTKLSMVFEFSLGGAEPTSEDLYGQYFDKANYGYTQYLTEDGKVRLSDAEVESSKKLIIDCVSPSFVYGSSIPLNFSGQNFRQVQGQLVAATTNMNNLDSLLSSDWDGAKYTAYVGGTINRRKYNEQTLTFEEYKTLIEGNVSGYEWTDRTLEVSLGSTEQLLDVAFPPNTYTTGENEGKVKPYVIGKVRNITPIEQAEGSQIYQFHDGTNFKSVDAVRDSGDALTNNGLVSDLSLASPGDGEFNYSSDGFIKVGGSPTQITMDVTGEETTCSIALVRLIQRHTSVTEFSVSYVDYQIGVYVTELTTVKELLYRLAEGMDLNIGINRFSQFFVSKRLDPFSSSPSFSLTSSDIEPRSIRRLPSPRRPSVYQVEYNRNWTIQNPNDLPSVNRREYSERAFFASSKRNVGTSTSGVKYIQTALTEKNQAEQIRDLINRDSRKRHLMRFTIIRNSTDINAGDVGEVTHPRFPFSRFVVLSVVNNPFRKEAKLEVVGYG